MTDRIAESGAIKYAAENTGTATTSPNRLAASGYLHAAYSEFITWTTANPGVNPSRLSAKGRLFGYFYDNATPLNLFATGAQGAWYDPSDYTTLFEDAAGTTPITSPLEKPVGLMLDKSRGLVLGSELVPSTISSISGAGWTTNGTSITATSSTASGTIALTTSTSTTKFYQVTFTASALSGATSYMVFSSSVAALTKRINAAKTYSFIVPGQGTAAFEIAPYEGTAFSVTISNISVRELPGNHATQSTTTARPTLSARYNLLITTETIGGGGWSGNAFTYSLNNSIAPNGTTTASLISETTDNNAHDVYSTVQPATIVGAQYKHACYMKAGTRTWGILRVYGAAAGGGHAVAYFDLANGVIGNVSSPLTASITAAGNGWYLCSVSYTAASASGLAHSVGMASANGTFIYAGDVSKNILVWGADLRVANDGVGLPSYQRVDTATSYDYAGFPAYVRFDGIDDSLVTNSIDFSATDKMSVFAGVRKLSDAAIGVVTEFSTGSSNGSFFIAAPRTGAAANYGFNSKGTLSSDAQSDVLFAAPKTNILTGLGNISGKSAIIRINGTQAASSSSDQGTGNYGNYQLFIGARSGPTLPFNGRIYSLIVCGKQLSASEITSMESWMNGKVKAY